MVIVLLVLPFAIVVALFAVDSALPMELIRTLNGSAALSATLSVLTLAAILVAAYRTKGRTHLRSAWLFLFCGVAILSLASLVDTLAIESESWTEELLSAASFFPLLFFAAYIATPLRLLIFSRRRRVLYVAAGIAVFLGVFALVFFPWLLTYEGPRLHASAKHLLRLSQPALDTILVEPLALLVLVIGLAGGGGPYVLVGVGLLLFIPEDVLYHFHLLRETAPHELFSDLLSIASRLYLLGGALLGIFTRARDTGSDGGEERQAD